MKWLGYGEVAVLVVLRRTWRFFLRAITCGFYDPEDGEMDSRQAIENLRTELAVLRASVGKILAYQCRIEHELQSERDRLADYEPGSAAYQSCSDRTESLATQLEAARADSEDALTKLQHFKEILGQAEKDSRNAQISSQLARMRAQIEQIALDQSLDENFAVLEHLNNDARDAVSRAEALRELNDALRQDLITGQKEEPGRQRINDSGSSDRTDE